jgi:N-acetylglutamate synthase-like GNAT family acetyltransferase
MIPPTLTPANPSDLAAVQALLRAYALPHDDLGAFFPDSYVVARDRDGVIGVAGLERHGDVGLLRSVAVAPHAEGRGLGRALVEERLAAASRQRLRRAFLLTTNAAEYFRRLGFRDVSRSEAPAMLQLSSQFAGGCCASAACMCVDLNMPHQD